MILPFNVTEENIKLGLGVRLNMAISNKFGNILLNTSNKSEAGSRLWYFVCVI